MMQIMKICFKKQVALESFNISLQLALPVAFFQVTGIFMDLFIFYFCHNLSVKILKKMVGISANQKSFAVEIWAIGLTINTCTRYITG